MIGGQHRGKGLEMAGGWAPDGAVNAQIEASIEDELARLKARKTYVGESLIDCAECGEEIAEARWFSRDEAVAGFPIKKQREVFEACLAALAA